MVHILYFFLIIPKILKSVGGKVPYIWLYFEYFDVPCNVEWRAYHGPGWLDNTLSHDVACEDEWERVSQPLDLSLPRYDALFEL